MYKILGVETTTNENWKEMMGGPRVPKNWKDPAKIEAKIQEWGAEALTNSPAYPLARKVVQWTLIGPSGDTDQGSNAESLADALQADKNLTDLFGLRIRPTLKAVAFEAQGKTSVPPWFWYPSFPQTLTVTVHDIESILTYGCATTIDVDLALGQLGMGPFPRAGADSSAQAEYVREFLKILF